MSLESERSIKRRKITEHTEFEDKFIKLNPIKRLSHLSAVVLCIPKVTLNLHHITAEDYKDFRDHHAEIFKRYFNDLGLPEHLLPYLFHIVIFMISNLTHWYDFVYCRSNNYYENMDSIIWSTKGNIDSRATFRKNILKSNLSEQQKYELACSFCLEEDIVKLRTPNVLTARYLESVNVDDSPMVYFWSSELSGNYAHLIKERDDYNRLFNTNLSENAFVVQKLLDKTFFRDCSIAIGFMWEKLTDCEKNNFIVKVLKGIISMDVQYYALSQLSFEQQRQALTTKAGFFMFRLLYSHYCDENFLTTANLLLDIMSPEDFSFILQLLIGSIFKMSDFLPIRTIDRNDYFFRELWQSAPNHLKTNVFNHVDPFTDIRDYVFFSDLSSLNWVNHFDLVRMCFEFVTPDLKIDILFSHKFEYLQKFQTNLKDGWKLFDDCVSMFSLFGEDLNVFKRELKSECDIDLFAIDYAKKFKWDDLDEFAEWACDSTMAKAKLREKVACHFFHFWADECWRKKEELSIPEEHLKRCLQSSEVLIDFHVKCLRNKYVLNIRAINGSAINFAEIRD